ncbi:hypothetical protein B0I35DRAFT_472548 [Stachybotrys elegans]|uniref:Apple domain-containing protein n=1 Tax=Stachybotrys elegans TaxID=80388 RepID=A0A8K0WVM5_9HYPO|nr:hypothetical protein B0I35DRAFT_472548 [Stachybotrys elegans]
MRLPVLLLALAGCAAADWLLHAPRPRVCQPDPLLFQIQNIIHSPEASFFCSSYLGSTYYDTIYETEPVTETTTVAFETVTVTHIQTWTQTLISGTDVIHTFTTTPFMSWGLNMPPDPPRPGWKRGLPAEDHLVTHTTRVEVTETPTTQVKDIEKPQTTEFAERSVDFPWWMAASYAPSRISSVCTCLITRAPRPVKQIAMIVQASTKTETSTIPTRTIDITELSKASTTVVHPASTITAVTEVMCAVEGCINLSDPCRIEIPDDDRVCSEMCRSDPLCLSFYVIRIHGKTNCNLLSRPLNKRFIVSCMYVKRYEGGEYVLYDKLCDLEGPRHKGQWLKRGALQNKISLPLDHGLYDDYHLDGQEYRVSWPLDTEDANGSWKMRPNGTWEYELFNSTELGLLNVTEISHLSSSRSGTELSTSDTGPSPTTDKSDHVPLTSSSTSVTDLGPEPTSYTGQALTTDNKSDPASSSTSTAELSPTGVTDMGPESTSSTSLGPLTADNESDPASSSTSVMDLGSTSNTGLSLTTDRKSDPASLTASSSTSSAELSPTSVTDMGPISSTSLGPLTASSESSVAGSVSSTSDPPMVNSTDSNLVRANGTWKPGRVKKNGAWEPDPARAIIWRA